ncbi:hypothetical protein E1A91_A04G183500v1 [Gossypium mustelinum]|uniref:Uncharacterized protein n=1 Tax=Gossypium mustelinum TaxID=34275 RepID=A0A5D2ZQ53_GOSMU|nr:hypothetical protein E1A91_A04G183500v1 [Gossypium mustelinum]
MSSTPYFSPQFPSLDVFERKESEVLPVEGNHRSWETRIDGGMDLDFRRQPHAVEFDVDFWPVEHPMEPQDEDRPVKCPMSAASSINNGKGHEEMVVGESSRKRSEQPQTVNGIGVAAMTEPLVRAVRKRQHTLTSDNHVTVEPRIGKPSLPPIPTPTLTGSQMLQQLDKA